MILQEPETPLPASLEEVTSVPLTPPSLGKPIRHDLRIGLIGAGRVVHNSVLPAYRQAGITPLAAADPDPEARAAAQRRWGIARVFADFREMLDAVDLDVVDVNIRWDVGLSPTRVAAVEEAARRGIHVLMAKPFAATYAQCRAMVEAAQAGGVTLAVDHNTRFAPVPHGIRSLIQAGVTGPLISASYLYHSAVGRQHTNAFDAAYDNVVHAADTLLTWFEQEPEEVYAHWSRRVDGVGSVFSGTLRFADGANATILFRLRHAASPPDGLRGRGRARQRRRSPGRRRAAARDHAASNAALRAAHAARARGRTAAAPLSDAGFIPGLPRRLPAGHCRGARAVGERGTGAAHHAHAHRAVPVGRRGSPRPAGVNRRARPRRHPGPPVARCRSVAGRKTHRCPT